jgi:protein-tyrosine phosphatase
MAAARAAGSSPQLVAAAGPALTVDQIVRKQGKQLVLKIADLAKESFRGYSQQERRELIALGKEANRLLVIRDTPALQELFLLPEAQRLHVASLFPTLKTEMIKTPHYDPKLHHMHAIIDDALYLGGVAAYKLLGDTGITHVVKVSHEQSPQLPDQVKLLHIGVPDESSQWNTLLGKASTENEEAPKDPAKWFERTFTFIDGALQNNHKVLVHCEVGMSRSATVVLAYLMNRCGISYGQALNHVKTRRPIVRPNAGFAQGLLQYDQELRKVERVVPKQFQELAAELQKLSVYNPFHLTPIFSNQKGASLLMGAPESASSLDPQQIQRIVRVRHMKNKPIPLPQGIIGFDLPLVFDEDLWQALLTGLKLPPTSRDHLSAFSELFSFIDAGLNRGEKVLIDCSDEVNQQGYAVILGAAYLMSRFKTTIKTTITYVMNKCPDQMIRSQLLFGLQRTFSPPVAAKPAECKELPGEL